MRKIALSILLSILFLSGCSSNFGEKVIPESKFHDIYDKSDIRINIKNETITKSTDTLNVEIINESPIYFIYVQKAYIEMLIDGKWYTIGNSCETLETGSGIQAQNISPWDIPLSSKGTIEVETYYSSNSIILEKGEYRLVVEVYPEDTKPGYILAAEFSAGNGYNRIM